MSTLAAELSTDPLDRGYSGMTDAEVAASLNAVNRPGPIPAKTVIKLLVAEGVWAKLVKSTEDADIELVQALSVFDDFDLQDVTPVNLSGHTARQVVDARLTASTHVSDAQKTAILALENSRQSRAQELGLGRVLPGEVAMARAS